MIYALFSIIYTTDNAYTDVQSKNTLSYTCMLTYQYCTDLVQNIDPIMLPLFLFDSHARSAYFPTTSHFSHVQPFPSLLPSPCSCCPPPLPFCRVPGAPSCKGISTSWWVTADVPLPHSRCGDPVVTWITTNRAQLTSLAECKEEFIFNNV